MSYQVLARQYRPRNFRELVGQEHVARALIHGLDQGRLHHAYLFTGTRGVGKTTIARILATCLNCETGISSHPCGQCATCREIVEGRYVDLIEIDAASRTKVEDTREILDNVPYAPTRGRYKVYLIDEVHMLSTSSFNALLKTLEEPPPHVKFLLATTDPQKLPVTILSRCLQFALKPMTQDRIVAHLAQILDKEMIRHEEPALRLLARAAEGSMRDALSLSDQAIAYGHGQLQTADVAAMLGVLDRHRTLALLQAVADADASAAFAVVVSMAEQSLDWSTVLADVLDLLHQLSLAQLLPERAQDENIRDLAARWAAEELQLMYQIVLQGRRDLPFAYDARSGFEMTLLRMLAFRPLSMEPVDEGQRSTPSPRATSAQTGGGGAAQPTSSARAQDLAAPLAELPAPSVEVASPADVCTQWAQMIPRLKLDSPLLAVAMQSLLLSQAQGWLLQVPQAMSSFLTTEMQVALQEQLRRQRGGAGDLQIVYVDGLTSTPRKLQEDAQRAEQALRWQQIEADAMVRAFQEHFGAQVLRDGPRLDESGRA